MQRRPIDPRIKLYYQLECATTHSRAVAIQDARTHIDVLNKVQAEDTHHDAERHKNATVWLKDTPAGVVINESVIGGGSMMDPPSAAVLFIGGMAAASGTAAHGGSLYDPPAAAMLFLGGNAMPPPAAAMLFLGGENAKHKALVV